MRTRATPEPEPGLRARGAKAPEPPKHSHLARSARCAGPCSPPTISPRSLSTAKAPPLPQCSRDRLLEHNWLGDTLPAQHTGPSQAEVRPPDSEGLASTEPPKSKTAPRTPARPLQACPQPEAQKGSWAGTGAALPKGRREECRGPAPAAGFKLRGERQRKVVSGDAVSTGCRAWGGPTASPDPVRRLGDRPPVGVRSGPGLSEPGHAAGGALSVMPVNHPQTAPPPVGGKTVFQKPVPGANKAGDRWVGASTRYSTVAGSIPGQGTCRNQPMNA